MRVAIIQPRLPHYRISFFNRLADSADLEVSVIHSGSEVGREGIAFQEIRVSNLGIGGVGYQLGIWGHVLDVDVVVAPLNVRTISNILLVLRHRPYRVIYWGHGVGQSEWANRVRGWMVGRASAAVLYGEEGLEVLKSFGVSAGKVYVAPNTQHVPNAGFDPTVERRKFLFVGRLQPRKKIDELLSAFARIRDEVPPSVGVEIVGDGRSREDLERLARELGIQERVTFWGRVIDDETLRPIFHRSLAYVSPGPVGLGVLHSFAYGVPVATRRDMRHAPEVHNIEHGQTGWLYKAGIGRLEELLLRLANNRSMSYKMGKASYRHYIEERGMDLMVCRFIDAIYGNG